MKICKKCGTPSYSMEWTFKCPTCTYTEEQMIKAHTQVIGPRGKERLFIGDKEVEQVDYRSMKIEYGCKGCNRYWYNCEPDSCSPEQTNKEGQCSRCGRCLACCGNVRVKYSCAWKSARKDRFARQRSATAYDRWLNNVNILGHNRRIT